MQRRPGYLTDYSDHFVKIRLENYKDVSTRKITECSLYASETFNPASLSLTW